MELVEPRIRGHWVVTLWATGHDWSPKRSSRRWTCVDTNRIFGRYIGNLEWDITTVCVCRCHSEIRFQNTIPELGPIRVYEYANCLWWLTVHFVFTVVAAVYTFLERRTISTERMPNRGIIWRRQGANLGRSGRNKASASRPHWTQFHMTGLNWSWIGRYQRRR